MKEDAGTADAQPATKSVRQRAAEDAREDLNKSDYQLLVDVHEELLHEGRSIAENLAHAYKRIASIMVRTAISNEQASRRILKLTVAIAAMTSVLVGLTVLMALTMFRR